MGIVLGSNFTVQTTLPLDDRFVAADTTARNAIASGRRFEGLLVYTIADSTMWQLKGGIANSNWVQAGGNDTTKANLLGGNVFEDTQEFADDVLFGASFRFSNTASITARAGGGQSLATQLAATCNRVTTCATAGDSVKLPLISSFGTGLYVFVQNDGAASLDVFPGTGNTIDALSVNLAFSVAPGANATFFAVGATAWKITAGASDATKANLSGGNTFTGTQTLTGDIAIGGRIKRSTGSFTARAGGGQALATQLTKDTNYITTCATAGDSVILPSLISTFGFFNVVHNDGAASLSVYPQSGEYINALAVDTPVTIAPGQNAIFFGVTSGKWKSFAGGGGGTRAGRQTLATNDQTKSVTFSSALSSTNYAVTCNFENTSDTDPFFVQHFISAKSTTGFTVKFNVPVDSANYVMNWMAIENA